MSPAKRKLLARLVLFGGLAFGFTRMLPEMPREQPLLFELSAAVELDRLDVELIRVGETEPRRGFSLPVAGSRRKVRHQVELPYGDYRLEARLTDKKGHETQISRRIVLDGNEIRVKIAPTP